MNESIVSEMYTPPSRFSSFPRPVKPSTSLSLYVSLTCGFSRMYSERETPLKYPFTVLAYSAARVMLAPYGPVYGANSGRTSGGTVAGTRG